MAPEKSRRVRVFVSSTFRDMQEERDELAKRVFPQIRKLCEERDIEWGEVDLRWGITENQAERGETIPICLAEIERCRPYFIGILGERYGWVPEEIPKDLSDQQPWLNEHRESSVTALEILHGVLNNREMADRSFFYFRNKDYLSKIPEHTRSGFLELASIEEITKYGRDEAEHRALLRKERLANLKVRIRESGLPVHENYRDPQEFGTLVLEDLRKIIDKFPPPHQLDALSREDAAHEKFAKSRFGVYIERQQYFDTLDAHANGDGLPLVILGESGSGKSALLAHWVKRYQERIQHDISIEEKISESSLLKHQPLILVHFIGATVESTDYVAMLRRLMGEFKRHFGIEHEIPEKPEEIRTVFANWLHIAAARGKVILVIDALNQLEDRDGSQDLVWLPPVIPPQVRLIVSTLPGRSLNNLREREWPTLEMNLLTLDERRTLIHFYLAQYRRTPSDKFVERISSAYQSQNPLFLCSLLEELRLYGDHDTLMTEAERYLAAEKIDDLFELILERWERDYNRERPELVQDVMMLLWAARRGMSEPELLDILGKDGKPLPVALWSPLSLAVEKSLVNRSGLLGFFHEYLRIAVVDRYLALNNTRERTHLQIAEYFKTREFTIRTLEELPWQYDRAGTWTLLHSVIKDLSFFRSLWNINQFDIKSYWADLESNSQYRIVETYQDVINHPEEYPDCIWQLAVLFQDTGNLKEGFKLQQFLTRFYGEKGDLKNFQGSLNNQATILMDWGQLKEALELLKEQERICQQLGDMAGKSVSLINQAIIFRRLGQLKESKDLLKEQERSCREFGYNTVLQSNLMNQAIILSDWGQFKEAMELLKEQERICRGLGDEAGLSESMGIQALILQARGQWKEAMDLHKEVEQISQNLGNKTGKSNSLNNQALILRLWGQLEEAMKLHKEQELICRELGYKAGLLTSLGNQAVILIGWGRLMEAMELLKEQERICRELGDKARLQASLNNQAEILKDWGQLKEAMDLHKEVEQICWELGDKAGLQRSLGNQALILQVLGQMKEAMKLHKEEERICRELGDKTGLLASLNNQAVILSNWGQLKEAMDLHKEVERICRELGYKAGLPSSLNNQAVILSNWGQLKEAMDLHKEAERICRELEDKAGLQRSLGRQALILRDLGQLKEAMELFKEVERICRELGDKTGLSGSFGIQAVILKDWGQLKEAMDLHKEEERICRELGDKAGLQRSLGNQAGIFYERGDLDGAMKLFLEQEQICRDLGDKAGLSVPLGNQAVILCDWGHLNEAMDLHKEEERICRELGNISGLANSLINQALIYQRQDNARQAVEIMGEAFSIAHRHGYTILKEQIRLLLQQLKKATEK